MGGAGGQLLAASSDEDAALLAAWRGGDADALGRLLARHLDTAYRIARRMLGNAEDAADAVQSAVPTLMAALRAGPAPDNPRAWIIASVINAARMRLREETRRRRREAVAARDHDEVGEASGDPQELREVVGSALAELPEGNRLPLWMHYREGLSVREISDALRLPDRTVRNRIARGLDLLRRRLERCGYGGAAGMLVAMLASARAEAAPPALAGQVAALAAKPAALGTVAASGAASTALGWTAAMLAAAGVAAVLILPTLRNRPATTAAAPAATTTTVATLPALQGPRLRHAGLDEALTAVATAQPAWADGYARFAALKAPWEGLDIDLADATPDAAMAQIAAASGATWTRQDGILVLHRRAHPGAIAEAAATLAAGGDAARRLAAIRQLADAAHPAALRPLLLAVGDADDAVASAALHALAAAEPALPRTPRRSLLAGSGDDAEIRGALERALERQMPSAELAELLARAGAAWAAPRLLAAIDARAGEAPSMTLRSVAGGDDSLIAVEPLAAPRGRIALAYATLLGPAAAPELAARLDPTRGYYHQAPVVAALGRAGGPQAAAALRPLVDRRMNPYLHGTVIEALGDARDPGALGVLAAIARSGDEAVDVVAALQALAALGSEDAARELLTVAADRRLRGRLARDLLGGFGAPARHALERALDEGLALAVAPALRMGSARAAELARQRLAAASPDEADELLLAFARTRSDEAVALLLALAGRERPAPLRAAALRHLPSTRDRVALTATLEALADPAPALRAAAATGLAQGPREPATEAALAHALADDVDAGVRAAAAQALGALRGGTARAALASALRSDGAAAVRRQALVALTAMIGGSPDDEASAIVAAIGAARPSERDAGLRARMDAHLAAIGRIRAAR